MFAALVTTLKRSLVWSRVEELVNGGFNKRPGRVFSCAYRSISLANLLDFAQRTARWPMLGEEHEKDETFMLKRSHHGAFVSSFEIFTEAIHPSFELIFSLLRLDFVRKVGLEKSLQLLIHVQA